MSRATEPAGPSLGERPPRPLVRRTFLKRLPLIALAALLVAILLRAFVVQTITVRGGSMEPALREGDVVLVSLVSGDPQRGDVIAFTIAADEAPDRRGALRKIADTVTGLGVGVPPYRKFMKRVIGMAGETVEIDRGAVFVTRRDGFRSRLDEPYVQSSDTISFGPVTVPENSYLVLGDNRPGSIDSRSGLGFVRRADVIGRVWIRA